MNVTNVKVLDLNDRWVVKSIIDGILNSQHGIVNEWKLWTRIKMFYKYNPSKFVGKYN